MPDNPNSGTGTTTTDAHAAGAGQGQQAANPDAYLEALTALRKEQAGLQSLMGRIGNELGTLRKQVETARRPAPSPGYDPFTPQQGAVEPDELAQLREELDAERRERQIDRFATRSGLSPEDWAKLQTRLQSNEEAYHRYDKSGRLDYFASYKAAWDDLRLEAFEAARQATEKQRIAQDQQREQQKRQATISGVGATGTENDQVLDVENMTSQEYFEKVLKPNGLVDPRDPVNPRPYTG